MPLHDDATERIREQLHRIAANDRVPIIEIGYLTYQQLQHVCDARKQLGLPIVESPTIVYIGRHHYQSRVQQGYTIDDMILQIQSSTSVDCDILIGRKMTVMRAALPRPDGYGNQVRDEAILELTSRKPRIELFSVVPKGDNYFAAPQTAKPLERGFVVGKPTGYRISIRLLISLSQSMGFLAAIFNVINEWIDNA